MSPAPDPVFRGDCRRHRDRAPERTISGALCSLLLAVVASLGLAGRGVAQSSEQSPVASALDVGQSVVTLVGPWRFHIGDDARWADPAFDDARWETVDLTAPPGAHDGDVGLSGYVPGWGAHGHAGYSGYAWYRLRIVVHARPGTELALAGPPSVDDAYQIFLNGRLLGGNGDFTHASPTGSPTAYSVRPRFFALPSQIGTGTPTLIAFRVWRGPWSLADPAGGGVRIAPQFGARAEVAARYKLQWLQTFDGYIVEVVEALLFVLLASMGLVVRLFDKSNRVYSWFAAALVLTAGYRANQAFFFWAQYETVHDFELFVVVLLIPAILAFWLLSWRAWFGSTRRAWVPGAVGALASTYALAEFLTRSWFHGTFPHTVGVVCAATIQSVRFLLLLLLALIVHDGIRERGREGWYALPAVLSIATGLFAQELSSLHVRGIWFPFGVGVSRTQYAYAVFDALLAGLFLRRLQGYARDATNAAFGHFGSITPSALDWPRLGRTSQV